MVKNCLVNTLKAPVVNNNLKKLGELELKVKNFNNSLILEYTNNVHTTQDVRYSGVTLTIDSATQVSIIGTGIVFFPLEGLRSLVCRSSKPISGNLLDSGINYAIDLVTLTIDRVDVGLSLSNLEGARSLQYLTLRGSNSSGNIASLLGVKNILRNLYIPSNPNIVGELTDLAKFKLIDNCDLSNTSITGDIVDFVHTKRLDIEAGSYTLDANKFITFNGVLATTYPGRSLSWTATTITWNNETITA